MKTNRRNFIRTGALAGLGLSLTEKSIMAKSFGLSSISSGNELIDLSNKLLHQWIGSLLKYQVRDKSLTGNYGGILCPSCACIHGRVADAIYPMMYMANETQDHKYVDSALMLYDWMERMVSTEDGAWTNEINKEWKGITVFTSIALAEALSQYGHLLDSVRRKQWEERLIKAADFIYGFIQIDKKNINYPINCAYALALIGKLFSNKRYSDRGQLLAHQCLDFITKTDKLIYGEGGRTKKEGPDGCYPIDLGYNVEESLPALVMYGKLKQDNEFLETVSGSLKSHAEFMLPDGAWDNSWGTRIFKWTYWGSRTSDGCQPAYALMADKHPEFYKVALQSTKLLDNCTHDNFLHGGPHYKQHGHLPCIHHVFCHSKALVKILENSKEIEKVKLPDKISLPREKEYGVKFFKDIRTWLISKSNWRATITGNNIQYYSKLGGHSSGGALTMLWNKQTGPLLSGSMIKYQMWEDKNMQMNSDLISMPLTPRFELEKDNIKYTNISDFEAEINYTKTQKEIIFTTKSRLLDMHQNYISDEFIFCEIDYIFRDNEILIKGRHHSDEEIAFILPVISEKNEKYKLVSDGKLQIHKPGGKLSVEANVPIVLGDTPPQGRLFNFVPGFEALSLYVKSKDFEIKLY